jgi:hypothetical protein
MGKSLIKLNHIFTCLSSSLDLYPQQKKVLCRWICKYYGNYLQQSLNPKKNSFRRKLFVEIRYVDCRKQKWLRNFGQKLEISTIVGWWLVKIWIGFFYQGSKIGTAVNTAHSFSPVQVLYPNNQYIEMIKDKLYHPGLPFTNSHLFSF